MEQTGYIINNMFKYFKTKQEKDKRDAIEKFRDERDTLITFEGLSEIPINETIQINPNLPGAIETTRLNHYPPNLMFSVSMKKGQLWEKHYHDCTETILVYKGFLRNLTNNQTATKAETMYFDKFTSHYVVAEEDSIFYVEFKNPLN